MILCNFFFLKKCPEIHDAVDQINLVELSGEIHIEISFQSSVDDIKAWTNNGMDNPGDYPN